MLRASAGSLLFETARQSWLCHGGPISPDDAPREPVPNMVNKAFPSEPGDEGLVADGDEIRRRKAALPPSVAQRRAIEPDNHSNNKLGYKLDNKSDNNFGNKLHRKPDGCSGIHSYS